MNITFLIGNGFDLRLGMKTRFTDMYGDYISQPPSSAAIKKFKDMLKADAPKYKTWGDFEMAMANKASNFLEEDSFIECLRDFKLYMVKHLENEQELFKKKLSIGKNTKNLCMQEVTTSIRNFYVGLAPNVRNEFINLGIGNKTLYSFISFNYTDTFDTLLKIELRNERVVHIHGRLGVDIVLGADNVRQIAHTPYRITRRFERAFIKPEFNKSYDNARVEEATNMIAESDVICIYGMSLGESDYTWVVQLKNWLLSSPNHHLVYFVHNETAFNKSNWDAIMDEEENRIASLTGKLCCSGEEMSSIFSQIHIPVGYDIFDIREVLQSEKLKDEESERAVMEFRKNFLKEAIQENLATMG